MKKLQIVLVCLLFSFISNAQISTVVNSFTKNLTKNDLPFSGDRTLYVIGLDDRNSQNYIVVSKNKIGADHDELYIEKFTANGSSGYQRSFSTKLSHTVNLSLSLANNQMTYQDSDKDGNAEWMLIVYEHQNGVESPVEKTNGVLVYNNKPYIVWRTAKDGFSKNYFDENFSGLPEKVRQDFLSFWDKVSYN